MYAISSHYCGEAHGLDHGATSTGKCTNTGVAGRYTTTPAKFVLAGFSNTGDFTYATSYSCFRTGPFELHALSPG